MAAKLICPRIKMRLRHSGKAKREKCINKKHRLRIQRIRCFLFNLIQAVCLTILRLFFPRKRTVFAVSAEKALRSKKAVSSSSRESGDSVRVRCAIEIEYCRAAVLDHS